MPSIRKEISTRASPQAVWAAIEDIGALHTRLVPGFVTDTRLEPGARLVTFANGMQARELIVDVDAQARRLVWTIVGGRMSHHNGAIQVFDQGSGSRVVWVADLLPAGMKEPVEGMMGQGMAVMQRTLDALAS